MKIKEVIVRKFNRKTKNYDRHVSIFEKYTVKNIKDNAGGYKTIEIHGPKQRFFLMQCAKDLTKIYPPVNEGENAIQEKLPLFFVTSGGNMMSVGPTKIQGATHFALRGDELIPYKTTGRSFIEEIGGIR